jgi:hypothetical protein
VLRLVPVRSLLSHLTLGFLLLLRNSQITSSVSGTWLATRASTHVATHLRHLPSHSFYPATVWIYAIHLNLHTFLFETGSGHIAHGGFELVISCLSLPSIGIIGVCHHAQPIYVLLMSTYHVLDMGYPLSVSLTSGSGLCFTVL